MARKKDVKVDNSVSAAINVSAPRYSKKLAGLWLKAMRQVLKSSAGDSVKIAAIQSLSSTLGKGSSISISDCTLQAPTKS